jgi:hypothetical protein
MSMAPEISSLCSWEFGTQTFTPPIHPSIHLFGHPLLNMTIAPVNNPPDQSVSKPVHFEGSNWLVKWIVERSNGQIKKWMTE